MTLSIETTDIRLVPDSASPEIVTTDRLTLQRDDPDEAAQISVVHHEPRLLAEDPNPRAGTAVFDVAIVGLGYVGLPTALAFHAAGRRVVGVDVSARRLAEIREQRADLLDDDRDRLEVALADLDGFRITSDVRELRKADAVIICVPTPVDASSHARSQHSEVGLRHCRGDR